MHICITTHISLLKRKIPEGFLQMQWSLKPILIVNYTKPVAVLNY